MDKKFLAPQKFFNTAAESYSQQRAAKDCLFALKIIALARTHDGVMSRRNLLENFGVPTLIRHDEMKDLLQLFGAISPACVVDAMSELGLPSGVLACGIRRVAGTRIVGRARTFDRVRRAGNQGPLDAAEAYRPRLEAVVDSLGTDEVLVIATQKTYQAATFGDSLALRGIALGAIGIVTDGAIRDSVEMDALGFTAFASGLSIAPGGECLDNIAVDVPVVCGGVLVRPGDLILGDIDGVVVVRKEDSRRVWARAVELCDAEQEVQELLRQGQSLATVRHKAGRRRSTD